MPRTVVVPKVVAMFAPVFVMKAVQPAGGIKPAVRLMGQKELALAEFARRGL
jgi:hypothetical protein